MIPFIEQISSEFELVGNIFRLIKDKLVNLILKDTSASCRDAGVSLIITFKRIIGDSPMVEQAISALPKYRISEIAKRVNPTAAENQETESNSNNMLIPTQDVRKGSETMIAKKSSKASDALSEACGAADGGSD